MTSAYVGDNTGTTVNLTEGPVVCAIAVERPLPHDAWSTVGTLALAVHRAAQDLRDAISRQAKIDPGPNNKSKERPTSTTSPVAKVPDAVGSSSGTRGRGRT